MAVHPPDSLDYYSPEVACGGGETWLTWYGKAPSSNEYDIYVTRWTGSEWEPPYVITAGWPGFHWFCDIAVDHQGRPHLTWGDSSTRKIHYSTRGLDASWSEPEVVNAGPSVLADGWPMVHVELDDQDNPHLIWVGRRLDSSTGSYGDQDVFYSRRDGSLWTLPFQVNAPDDAQAYYPELKVVSADDIWIAWHDEGGSWTEPSGVMVAHLIGNQVRDEARLDAGVYHWNHVARIVTGHDGFPLVLWSSIHGDFSESAILFSEAHPDTQGVPVLLGDLAGRALGSTVVLTWSADPDVFIGFEIERGQGTGFHQVAGITAQSGFKQEWSDDHVPLGEHLYRIHARDRAGKVKTLGPISVQVAVAAPLTMTLSGSAEASTYLLLTGARGMEVRVRVLDLQGRVVQRLEPVYLDGGPVRRRLERGGLADGVYFIRGTGGGVSQAVKWVVQR